MIYDLEITSEADTDAKSAADYYDSINGELADRFLNELQFTINKVVANPQFYKYILTKDPDQFRYTKLNSFPYIVVFRIEKKSIVVYKVFNTYRKPWYE